MANILGVGVATLDIINTVADYPAEDTEVRALSQRITRGGNATNTLVVLSQLGHCTWWAGTLAKEPDAQHILDDLTQFQINTRYCHTLHQGKVPTSYVTLNRRNGSRTIVHYRNLPELDFEFFSTIDLTLFDWIHFEARNIAATRQMLEDVRTRASRLRVSVEVEKPREHVESLFPYAGVLIFSQSFARACGAQNAKNFLERIRLRYDPPSDLLCSWGKEGASLLSREGEYFYSPAISPPQVIDTLGAGDTFNAAVIDGYVRGFDLTRTLHHACRLAGLKCGKIGLELEL